MEAPRIFPPDPVACRLASPKPMLTVPLLLPKVGDAPVLLTGPPLIKSSKERFCGTGFDGIVPPAPAHDASEEDTGPKLWPHNARHAMQSAHWATDKQ